jgi:hypothetical protein
MALSPIPDLADVLAVQSGAAPAAYRSWRAASLVTGTTSTFAEGLATRTGEAVRVERAGPG